MQEEPVRINPVKRSEWVKLREDQIRVNAENALRQKEYKMSLAKTQADGYLENFWRHAAEGGDVKDFFIVRNVDSLVEEMICKKLEANGWKCSVEIQERPRDLSGDETFDREIRVVE